MWQNILNNLTPKKVAIPVAFIATRLGLFGTNEIELDFPMNKEHRVGYNLNYRNFILFDTWNIKRIVDTNGLKKPMVFKRLNLLQKINKNEKTDIIISRVYTGISIRPCNIVGTKYKDNHSFYDEPRKEIVHYPNSKLSLNMYVGNTIFGYLWFKDKWKVASEYLEQKICSENKDYNDRYNGKFYDEDLRNEYEYTIYNVKLDEYNRPEIGSDGYFKTRDFRLPKPKTFEEFQESMKTKIDKIKEKKYVNRIDVDNYLKIVRKNQIWRAVGATMITKSDK
jgi:hypothetical protein